MEKSARGILKLSPNEEKIYALRDLIKQASDRAARASLIAAIILDELNGRDIGDFFHDCLLDTGLQPCYHVGRFSYTWGEIPLWDGLQAVNGQLVSSDWKLWSCRPLQNAAWRRRLNIFVLSGQPPFSSGRG